MRKGRAANDVGIRLAGERLSVSAQAGVLLHGDVEQAKSAGIRHRLTGQRELPVHRRARRQAGQQHMDSGRHAAGCVSGEAAHAGGLGGGGLGGRGLRGGPLNERQTGWLCRGGLRARRWQVRKDRGQLVIQRGVLGPKPGDAAKTTTGMRAARAKNRVARTESRARTARGTVVCMLGSSGGRSGPSAVRRPESYAAPRGFASWAAGWGAARVPLRKHAAHQKRPTPSRMPGMIPSPEYESVCAWLAACRRPLVVTHRRPDGDALGAVAAMSRVLAHLGPRAVTDAFRTVAAALCPASGSGAMAALGPGAREARRCVRRRGDSRHVRLVATRAAGRVAAASAAHAGRRPSSDARSGRHARG